MNSKVFNPIQQRAQGGLFKAVVAIALTALLSGCYLTAAVRDYQRVGGTTPWWCQGTPDLTQEECLLFSAQLDVAEKNARLYPTVADLPVGAANVTTDTPADTGEAYALPGVDFSTFTANMPQILLYAGSAPTARLVGVMWASNSVSVPAGFPGARDVWSSASGALQWALPAWIIRGYQNHPNVFAASHPCLASGVTLASTADACYVASHTEDLEVLVTNDDGVMAPGIDALVEGLYGLPNVVINVVAPAANQSGSGDATTGAGFVVSASVTTTLSGKTATAVSSTDPARPSGSGSPADAVNYALGNLYLSPEIVISGINSGQNYSTVGSGLSGTVGAARTARRTGVPALATSQGSLAAPWDFPAGVVATLALLENWRLGLTVNTNQSVLNINTPTCIAGFSPRGTLTTVVKPAPLTGAQYVLQDCTSTEPIGNITNDLEAFNHGFIGITDMGAQLPPNWP